MPGPPQNSRSATAPSLALAASSACVIALLWSFPGQAPWLLHLLYLPVALAGYLRWGFSARFLALACVVLVSAVCLSAADDGEGRAGTMGEGAALALWACCLSAIAVLADRRKEAWEAIVEELRATHRRDVFTDALTGAANRRAFEYELERRLKERTRTGAPLSTIFLDLDHFKQLNDRYGHDAGDSVLQQAVAAVREAVRESDLVARVGGEEFAVLLPGADVACAIEVAERARQAIERRRFDHERLSLRATASLGVACLGVGEEGESLLKRADAALYVAKEAGRNCVYWHDGTACRASLGGAAAQPRSSCAAASFGGFEHRDRVTGLASRSVFLDELRRRVAEAQRYGWNFTAAVVRLNDYSNAALQQPQLQKRMITRTGRLLTSILREPDLVARFDVDSLAVLMPATRLAQAHVALERVQRSAADYRDPAYPDASFALTLGAAESLPGDDANSLLERLTASLAAASEPGTSRIIAAPGAS